MSLYCSSVQRCIEVVFMIRHFAVVFLWSTCQ